MQMLLFMFYLDIQVSGHICYIGLHCFDPFVFTCDVGKHFKIIELLFLK